MVQPHLIIGLLGKKGSGKSTVAKFLCEHYGFVEIALAEPLKEIICKRMFYMTDEQLYGSLKDTVDERWGVTPRQIQKDFGKFIRDRYGGEFMPRRAMYKISELISRYQSRGGVRVVVSDCRFPPELEMLEMVGGFTCRIVKNAQSEDQDITETAVDNIQTNFTLSADPDDLNSLYRQADRMMLAVSKVVLMSGNEEKKGEW